MKSLKESININESSVLYGLKDISNSYKTKYELIKNLSGEKIINELQKTYKVDLSTAKIDVSKDTIAMNEPDVITLYPNDSQFHGYSIFIRWSENDKRFIFSVSTGLANIWKSNTQ